MSSSDIYPHVMFVIERKLILNQQLSSVQFYFDIKYLVVVNQVTP